MSWLRIDDTFIDHPKIMRAGLDAPLVITLQLRAISYASKHLTDGFLAEYVIRSFTYDLGRSRIEAHGSEPQEWAEAMVNLELWERRSRGYQIHDYLQYNRSRQQAESKNKQKQLAGRIGGIASGKQRRSTLLHSASTKTKQPSNPRPVPSPSPEDRVNLTRKDKPAEDPAGASLTEEFESRFWPLYPKRREKPKALVAFRAARKRASLEDILAGLQRCLASAEWREDSGRYIPWPAKWLSRERWADGPDAIPQDKPWKPPEERAREGDRSGLACLFAHDSDPEPAA